MVKFKGSCDSRDLEKDAQFYYEKLVQWLNDNAVNDDECVEAIEVLKSPSQATPVFEVTINLDGDIK